MLKDTVHPQIKPIDKDNLNLKLLRKEPVEIVNVLSPNFYFLGSIKESKRIPLEFLESRIKELNKNKEIITYSSGYDSSDAYQAAEILANRGFRVRAYEGGLKEWREANLPLE